MDSASSREIGNSGVSLIYYRQTNKVKRMRLENRMQGVVKMWDY